MQLIVANFVVFTILAPFVAMSHFWGPITISTLNIYTVGFQVWASISLAIDTTIAGIMIWSVRN